ncbi:MAG: SWIM zinc finger domain-containing protein [Bacteroidia bacterium]|nr:SWIM zinc finger domain-containing protein [Bacteroidia bacterium]MDW8300897.1 SWIM zinc finger family protein [Bacteroidia bacterium]
MLTNEKIQSLAASSDILLEAQSISTNFFNTGTKEYFYWGEYQGSGANPYTIIFDASVLAYSCSCPASKRQKICKHVLGLMIKALQKPEEFLPDEPPTWAEKWIKKHIQDKYVTNEVQKPVIGLARIRGAKSKEAQRRESQMTEGLELLKSYLNNVLDEGTTLAFTWDYQSKLSLVNSLNAAKMPELAHLIDQELKNNPAETIAKSAILWNLWQKRDILSPEFQEILLNALGSYLKKEQVQQYGDIVKDRWLCVGYYADKRTKPTIMLIHHWILIGQNTGQWTYVVDTEVFVAKLTGSNKQTVLNLEKGQLYEGSIAYYPGLQKGILLSDWRECQDESEFSLTRPVTAHHLDESISKLPLFFSLHVKSPVYLKKVSATLYHIQAQNKVYVFEGNLENLWATQGKEGITLIYLQIYPHSIIPLGGILHNNTYILLETDINKSLRKQAKLSETLKKHLEAGKKLGPIQVPGLDNTGLEPIQQWARAFLVYNYILCDDSCSFPAAF